VRFAVLELDIVSGAMPLYEVVFKDQRLDLGIGDDEFDIRDGGDEKFRFPIAVLSGKVRFDAVFQRPGFSDVDDRGPGVPHEIDSGECRNIGQKPLQAG